MMIKVIIMIMIIIMITKTHNNDNINNDNMMIIENDNNDNDNNSDNDDKDNDSDNNDDNDKIPVDSPHKGPIMLSFDVTFVESKNNSRVSGNLRHHVPHVASLWWDIIYATPSYLYCCKQLWINWFIYVHLYSKLCKMQQAVMFWQHSNPISGGFPSQKTT